MKRSIRTRTSTHRIGRWSQSPVGSCSCATSAVPRSRTSRTSRAACRCGFAPIAPADAHAMVGLLDLGDIVGITGPLTRTRRGEPSVLVDTVTLLVKALHCAAGEVPRTAGPGDEVPQALSRPAQQRLAATPLRHANALDPRVASDAGSARLSRGRDAHPATDSRRRPRAAVPDALECAAHRCVPPHRHRAAPQAFDRRRLCACVRDRSRLPQ